MLKSLAIINIDELKLNSFYFFSFWGFYYFSAGYFRWKKFINMTGSVPGLV